MNVEILKRLHVLRKSLNTVPYLNYGGCGVAASVIGQCLQQIEGITNIKPIVENYWGNTNLDNIKKEVGNRSLREWSAKGYDINHVLIAFKYKNEVWIIDSVRIERVPPNYLREYYDLQMTLEDCIAISACPDGWNKTFDRDNIPKIFSKVRNLGFVL